MRPQTTRDVLAGARHWGTARLTALASAVAALGVSVYHTIEHYDQRLTLACPETGTINCAKVTSSQWSRFVGIPVAVLGLAYFAVMVVVLALPSQRRELALARIALAAAGMVMVLYLVYIELFRVDAICLWCTAVHVLAFVILIATLWDSSTS